MDYYHTGKNGLCEKRLQCKLRTTITTTFGSNYRLLIVVLPFYFLVSSPFIILLLFFFLLVRCLVDTVYLYCIVQRQTLCCAPYFIALGLACRISFPANKLWREKILFSMSGFLFTRYCLPLRQNSFRYDFKNWNVS